MNEQREIDCQVAAEVFGFKIVAEDTAVFVEGEWSIHPGSNPQGWNCFANIEPLYLSKCECTYLESEGEPLEKKTGGHYSICLEVVPYYSERIEHAFDVEVEIMRRGFATQYGGFLTMTTDAFPELGSYAIAHASPMDRCKAALSTVRSNA